jgi:hypothetical protein
MLTFFAVVNSGVAIVCAIFYYFLYAVTFNTDLLFDVHIHGKRFFFIILMRGSNSIAMCSMVPR